MSVRAALPRFPMKNVFCLRLVGIDALCAPKRSKGFTVNPERRSRKYTTGHG